MMRALQVGAFLTLLFLIGPLAVVVVSAFGRTAYLAFPPDGLTFHWYQAALTNPDYIKALATSIKVACLVTVLSLLIGVPAAVALARGDFPGRRLIEACFVLPLVLPTLALSVAVTLFLGRMGVPPSLPRLAVVHLAICTPYVVRVMLPLLRSADPAIEEAAASLGANPLRVFVRVTLPTMRPGILGAAVLSFIASFDEFDLALLLSAPQSPTLPVLLFGQAEYGAGATVGAVSGLLIALAVLGMAVGQLLLRGKVT